METCKVTKMEITKVLHPKICLKTYKILKFLKKKQLLRKIMYSVIIY